MGAAEITTDARLAAIMASLNESRALLASCARRLGVKGQEGPVATAPSLATMTTPTFMPHRLLEQKAKPSSSSLFSAIQVVSVGAPQANTMCAATLPTTCSTLGPVVNLSNNPAVIAFRTSGTPHLAFPTLNGTGERVLHSAGGTGVNTPIGCSTHVLSLSKDVPGARAQDVDANLSAEVLTHVGGLSLFQELEINYVGEAINDGTLKDVLWYEELADCVVTKIGRSSLFIEQIMETRHELEREIDKTTHLCAVPSTHGKMKQLLTRDRLHGSDSATFFLPSDSDQWISFVFAISGLSRYHRLAHALTGVFSRRKEARKIGQCTLIELPPWSRNGFSPGFHVQPYLGTIPPWMHRGFSPGVSFLISITESRLFALKVWIQTALGEFPVMVHSAQFDVSASGEVNPSCLPIILAKFDTCSLEWLPSYTCIFSDDIVFMIQIGFRLTVGSIDMIKILYIDSNFHISEETTDEIYPANIWRCHPRGILLANQVGVVHEPGRAGIHLPTSDLPFVPLLSPWYCTMTGTTRMAMEIAAHYYSSAPQDNCCLVNNCEIILASCVTHTLFSDCYSSTWLRSINTSVHLCLHFSNIDCWFIFCTWLKSIYGYLLESIHYDLDGLQNIRDGTSHCKVTYDVTHQWDHDISHCHLPNSLPMLDFAAVRTCFYQPIFCCDSLRTTEILVSLELQWDPSIGLNHEQITYVRYGLVVIHALLLSPRRLHGLDCLIVPEHQGLYWTAIMHIMTWVEILDAHVQWDPG